MVGPSARATAGPPTARLASAAAAAASAFAPILNALPSVSATATRPRERLPCAKGDGSGPRSPSVDAQEAVQTPQRASELVTPQTAVDRDDRPGDVAGQRRGQEAHEVREVLRAAVLAHRDLL